MLNGQQENSLGLASYVLYTIPSSYICFVFPLFSLLLERDLHTITKTSLMSISICVWKLHQVLLVAAPTHFAKLSYNLASAILQLTQYLQKVG